MATRIYVVTQGLDDYLVRADTQAQARSHIAKDIAARVASQDDLVTLTAAGVKVQDAGDAAA